MDKYRVFGDKLHKYYTVITAPDEQAAWDIASNRDDLDWFEVETDETVEPYEVIAEAAEEKIDLDLLDDGYPSMANEILVMDKTDK